MTHTLIALQWFTQVNIFTTLSLIIAVMAFCIGFYAFGKTQKTKGSVLMLGLCVTIGIWVFASAFIFSADPEDSVWFWYYIQSFGFIPMWPILIHFFTVISGLDQMPGRKTAIAGVEFNLNFPNISVIVQYAIAIALHLWILAGAGEPAAYVPTPLGLRDTPAMDKLCVQIFVFMTLFWYFEGTLLVIIFWKKSHKKNVSVDMRKQSEVITITGIGFGGVTLVLNIILPIFELPIPAFGSLFIGMWIMCIAYAVARYNLGAKDEQIIGQKAFDLSEEPMVVTDKELNILFFNRSFTKNFGALPANHTRKVPDLFPNEEGEYPEEDQFHKEGFIAALSVPGRDGIRRFYNVQSSYIYNRRELDRILFIFSDITEITNQKQILEYLVDERTAEINRQLVITEKYTRPSLVQVIQAGGDPTNFEPANRNMVIMFADIRDFTLVSEKLSSSDTVRLLNSYFTCMNECIVQEKGEIDKLIGDGIMALFENSDSAVHAAINMIYKLQNFNASQCIVDSIIRNGIGINYGPVTRGNIGSKDKLDYTVIGDSVNAASRFESLTKRYRLPIVISEDVVGQLRHNYKIRFIDNVLVKGRAVPTKLYEVFDYNNTEMIDIKLGTKSRLEEAFAAYAEGNFTFALELYQELERQNGQKDPLIQFYIHRTQELDALQKLGKLESWNGIYQFVEK